MRKSGSKSILAQKNLINSKNLSKMGFSKNMCITFRLWFVSWIKKLSCPLLQPPSHYNKSKYFQTKSWKQKSIEISNLILTTRTSKSKSIFLCKWHLGVDDVNILQWQHEGWWWSIKHSRCCWWMQNLIPSGLCNYISTFGMDNVAFS